MLSPKVIVNSVGYLEGWLEKAGQQHKMQVENPLQHLKVLEDALRDYRKDIARLLQTDAEQKQKSENSKFSSDEGAPANVMLEINTDVHDSDNFGNLFVHISSADGVDYFPGRVYRGVSGVCFELWPIPRKFVMTLTELKALVKEMEVRKNKLPFDDGAPGIA
jgi:hypothetical protein